MLTLVARIALMSLVAWSTIAGPCAHGGERDSEQPGAKKTAADAASAAEFFHNSALPVLVKRCYECHSHAAGKAKGGLMLDSRAGWQTGGDSGPAIVPGKPDKSLLIQAVRYHELEMPPDGKLPAAEIALLERWVANGAFDSRQLAEPAARAKGPTDERVKHWAFQPVGKFAPPQVRDGAWPLDDVDRFLLAKLEAAQLRPVADADRYTWLRRVSLDLVGLPPTPAELQEFVADRSPHAYERVVDRLLASRGFGERWARHWLDLVGYADQIGTANDLYAEHAWRYRDYVIAAFNADKPIDQFLREQIAGDLLQYNSPEQRAEQLTATGFLLLGDLTVVEADKAKLRVDVVDQQVDKLGKAALGLTLGCARCHDHKFDPISQRDYYAVAGIFNGTVSIEKAPWGIWSWPATAELPETPDQRKQREEKFSACQKRVDQLKAERETAKRKAADKQTTAEEKKALEERIKQLDREIVHAEFFAPAKPRAFAVYDAAEPADMRITVRGNAHALGEIVPRGFVQIAAAGKAPAISAKQSGRLQLAAWITDSANPLTARVAVNRIWQKLFGEGLARSVDYFGLRGEQPSHPELLDYLAARFTAGGWSQKRLIRELVLSRAYRLSGGPDKQAQAGDPDNRLLWRMNRRRLDAEALRDSLLAVSGRLSDSPGGPSLPLEYVENTGGLSPKGVNPPNFRLNKFRPEQQFVRTIYLPVVRSGPQAGPAELRNVFDFTLPAEFAGQRPVTAVPTQALFLMNSDVMKQRARQLAELVCREEKTAAARLALLWLRTLNRPITPAERQDAAAFLDAASPDETAASDLQRWTELCQAVLASNEFLMRM